MDVFLQSLIPDMSTPTSAIAQVIGWVGMILIVISFQFKNIKYFYLSQAIGNACFTVSFFLIGSYAGAGMNLIGGIRSVVYLWESNRKKKAIFWGILGAMAVFSVVSAFTGDSWAAILPFIAQATGTISMAYGSDRTIRIIQASILSPLWLSYNIISPVFIHGKTVQWGQVICECINIISAVVFIIRAPRRIDWVKWD